MPLIYAEPSVDSASAVIRKMLRLKSRRYNHEISRQKYLFEWEKLRKELNETPEYKELRRLVFARSGGKCEKCKTAPGTQMCHKMAVAYRPELALRKDNVYLGCLECHQLDHPDLKLS
jgi:hypothetical protein